MHVAGPARKRDDRHATQNTTTEEMAGGRWGDTSGLTSEQELVPGTGPSPVAATEEKVQEAENPGPAHGATRAPRKSSAPTVGEGTDVNEKNIVSGRRVRATKPIQSNDIIRYMFK